MKAHFAIFLKKRIAALALCLLLAALLLPAAAQADGADKCVRVGWYDSSFNTVDDTGRRSGYAYEYQLKLAAYTGWTYEYVTGSWSELLQKLIDGEIDLMSDVSWTAERAKLMLYPELPMGAEEYFLFKVPGNLEIRSADPSTLNGKRIGVNKDSVQADFFRGWAQRNDIRAELVELSVTEDESLRMMETGTLDAYVTVDSFTDPSRAESVYKVGSSDYYFAVAAQRPDLLAELNAAMSKIQDEDRYFNQKMFERYIKPAGSNAFLSPKESDWLASHGPIRVGYQDNYLAFCAADGATGKLTGAIRDYLELASGCLMNAHLDFEATAFPSVAEAIEALRRGEVDCVFPANFSGYEGEKLGIVLTLPLMRTDMYALVRHAELGSFARKEHTVVAVNKGNPNYDSFLLDHFPSWRRVYYDSTEDCLRAVAQGVADCVVISGYRYNNLSRACDKYDLTTFPTGVGMDYCFAVGQSQTELYSILSKAVGQIPASTVNAALSFYITEDARLSLADFFEDHLGIVLAVAGAVLLLFLLLLIRSVRAERRAKSLISATETDALTGLYNRDYFFQYANRIFRDRPDTPMDAVVLNIEQFHMINALNGREFGDRILRVLGNELRVIAAEVGGIGGRFGADRFDLYCRSGLDYPAIYALLQGKLDDLMPKTSVRLRMGVAPWQAKLEPVQHFDRARTACSMARGHYREHLIVFDESVRERELLDQRLLNDLHRALDSYELEVYYQPKFDIRTAPPRLVSAEALVRWRHPQLGLLPPGDFIPLFERNGMIRELDRFVWAQTARQIARWRLQYGVTLPISVNLSRVDVFDPTLEKTLDGIVRENGLEPAALRLEVTESAYTENEDQVITVIERLRKKGYEIEMDDFGTGYSSLNMLSAMPVDALKMDRAFIRNIEHSEKDVQLVALILEIARNLNIPVVAEGVETASQLQRLKDLGCTMVQGFYFSKPLHPTEFGAEFVQTLAAGNAQPEIGGEA